MATQPTTKTQTRKTKNAPAASKSVQTKAIEAPYEIVTAFRLKRCKIKPDDQKVSFFLDSETFKSVQLLGIQKYGVTWDEVVKGLIDRELADVNGGSDLSHFIPVIQL